MLNANNGNGRNIHVPFDSAESYTFTRPERFTKDGKEINYFCTDPTGEYGRVFNIGETVPMLELKAMYDENGEELIIFAIWHDGRNRGGQNEKVESNTVRSGGGGGGGVGGGGGMSLNNVQNPYTQMTPQAANQTTPLESPLPDGMGGNPTVGNWVYEPTRGVWEYLISGTNQAAPNAAQTSVVGTTITAGSSGGSGAGSTGGAGGGGSFANGGWYLIGTATGNKWYNFDTTNAMRTGFIQSAGKIYYLAMTGNEIGQMQTGAVLINGAYYYFNNDGSLFTNGITPEGLVVDALGKIIG